MLVRLSIGSFPLSRSFSHHPPVPPPRQAKEIAVDFWTNIWYSDLQKCGEKYIVLAIVGNKTDLYEKEAVPEDEARKYAKEINAIFMLTSAKIGSNIDFLFETLVKKYLEPEFTKKVDEMKKEKGEVTKITAENNQEDNNKKKRKCC